MPCMNTKKQFSRRLKLLRKSKGVSQEKLAKIISRNVETVSHLERGLSFPNADTFDRICEALSTPPREFFSVSLEDGEKQKLIDEIDTELLKLDRQALDICLGQIRALTKQWKK